MEGTVDFDQIQTLRQILERVKPPWLDRGIDDGVPIGVRPTGRATAKFTLHGEYYLPLFLFSFSSLFILAGFASRSQSIFFGRFFEGRNIRRKRVVFLVYPRYDSGRTHPYHPSAPAFLFFEHPLE